MIERSILHWNGGAHTASDLDRQHYHGLIEVDGKFIEGHEEVADNIVTSDGDYAAHTRHLNTGSGGFALCGMHGATERPFNPGRYPIVEFQFDAACEVLADFNMKYDLPVARRTNLTHAEVEPILGVPQRGKWDITRLPWLPNLRGAIPVGDHMRSRIMHYMGVPEREAVPILALGDRGGRVRMLQRSLVSIGARIGIDGVFGPRTEMAVMRFQSRQGLAVDGIVGPETWGALS